jgi:hypothetical protein
LYFINTQGWIQVPSNEPSIIFETMKVEEDRVTMKITCKSPKFYFIGDDK